MSGREADFARPCRPFYADGDYYYYLILAKSPYIFYYQFRSRIALQEKFMAKILVISGHPDYKNSVANRAILDDLHRSIPEAEIVYLDALYPDFRIDVPREQERVVGADIIVFEFPFWWFGSPSLMHRYVEDVFVHGFAYGSGGNPLKGKKFILSFTTGAPEAEYSPTGAEGFALESLLPPFLAMAKFVKLDYVGYVVSYGMALIDREDKKARDAIMAKARIHAEKLAALING